MPALPFNTWHFHAVDIGHRNLGVGVEYVRHFVGRHILGAPAEGIAGAVHELEVLQTHGKTDIDLPHQIAAIEPAVAIGLDIFHDLAGSRLGARVALKFSFGRDLTQ